MQGGYQGQGGYSQYPDQYNQQYPAGGNYPPNRPMYPPYGPDAERFEYFINLLLSLKICQKKTLLEKLRFIIVFISNI